MIARTAADWLFDLAVAGFAGFGIGVGYVVATVAVRRFRSEGRAGPNGNGGRPPG